MSPSGAPVAVKWQQMDPSLICLHLEHQSAFAGLFDGQKPEQPLCVGGPMYGSSHPLEGRGEIDMLEEPDRWLDDVADDMRQISPNHAGNLHRYAPLVVELDAFGTHYIDAVFGSQVYTVGGQAWSDPLQVAPGDLAMPDLDSNPVLQKTLRLAAKAVARFQPPVIISTPVLSCPINIAVNLFGQRILEDLEENPAAAHHAIRVVTDVILGCLSALFRAIPQHIRRVSVGAWRYMPPGYGFIDGCATQLVSLKHYREFFADMDAEILRESPNGGMIHLCGASAQHVPAWHDMAELKVVQLNDRATDDFELYWNGLRKDQLFYVCPTATYTAERLLQITQGERLVLQSIDVG